MQTRSSDENSVRLSVRLPVCPSNASIVAKRKRNQWSEIADFKQIIARSASAVTIVHYALSNEPNMLIFSVIYIGDDN